MGDQSSSIAEAEGPKEARPAYFTVGAVKFSLMSLTTLGLYELYWLYRNWQTIRDRHGSNISPFWRAFFAPLWTFSMGSRLKDEADDRNIPVTLPVIALGVAYFLLSATWRLPGAYWLLGLLTFVPLLPFELAVRRLDGDGELAAPRFGRFTRWNIAWLIIGSILLVLAIVGSFIPDDVAGQAAADARCSAPGVYARFCPSHFSTDSTVTPLRAA